MRLKVPAAAANEELIALINEGYYALHAIQSDHQEKRTAGTFNDDTDNTPYSAEFERWADRVLTALRSIFPTELEPNTFLHPEMPFGAVSGDYRYESLMRRFKFFIQGLNGIRQTSIPQYTDLPLSTRLFVEDIDSFRKVRDVNPAAAADLLQNGRFEWSEDSIQLSLEQILDVSMHKKDWGGEVNDLYTCNVIINGERVPTAFLLKGNGLKKKTMEIRDCGANGDQLLRLLDSPASLFVIQFVGSVSESVIRDVSGKVDQARTQGKDCRYCIIDGQDTARLLRAYGRA
jgi:hypothetical protein